jgi:F-type H+-transporting ATPase subunit delta
MRDSRTAHRYAKAILQLAEEEKRIDKVTSDFEFLDKLLQTSRDLRLLFSSPVINNEKKKKAINALFGSKVDELTLRFLLLLTTKNREALLHPIIVQYRGLLDEKNNIIRAQVSSVIPFTESQTEELIKKLEGITRKKVKLSYHIDPILLGGFKVRIHDTILDGSILQQFKLMKDHFIEAGTLG